MKRCGTYPPASEGNVRYVVLRHDAAGCSRPLRQRPEHERQCAYTRVVEGYVKPLIHPPSRVALANASAPPIPASPFGDRVKCQRGRTLPVPPQRGQLPDPPQVTHLLVTHVPVFPRPPQAKHRVFPLHAPHTSCLAIAPPYATTGRTTCPLPIASRTWRLSWRWVQVPASGLTNSTLWMPAFQRWSRSSTRPGPPGCSDYYTRGRKFPCYDPCSNVSGGRPTTSTYTSVHGQAALRAG